MSDKRENYLILTQLLLQYALKTQEIARLFAAADVRGGDVTDEEVDASGLKADAALSKLKVEKTPAIADRRPVRPHDG